MKALLILDAATEVPALAFRLDEPSATPDQDIFGSDPLAESIIRRAGFGRARSDHRGYVVLIRADGACFRAEFDPFAWDNLTMTAAHRWLVDHLEEHPAGGALDVESMRLAMVAGATSTPEHDSPHGYLP